MKSFTFLAIAGLVLFATAAIAQHDGGHRGNMGTMGNQTHMPQANSSGGGCAMNGMQNRMGSQGVQGNSMQGNTTQTAGNTNWRANPSYQGQPDQTAPSR